MDRTSASARQAQRADLTDAQVADAVLLAEKITNDQIADELMHDNIKEGFSNEFVNELYNPDKLTEPIKTIEVRIRHNI
jgi:hypothetical protein